MEPMTPQQLPRRRIVSRALAAVSAEQIAHERQVVREAFVAVLVQPHIELVGHSRACRDLVEVALQLRPGERIDDLARQLLKLSLAALAQIPTAQLVAPGCVAEPRDRLAVNLLHLRR